MAGASNMAPVRLGRGFITQIVCQPPPSENVGKKEDIGLQLLGPWAAAAADGRRALQVLDVWKPL